MREQVDGTEALHEELGHVVVAVSVGRVEGDHDYRTMMCGKMCCSVLADRLTVFIVGAMRISLVDTFTLLCAFF